MHVHMCINVIYHMKNNSKWPTTQGNDCQSAIQKDRKFINYESISHGGTTTKIYNTTNLVNYMKPTTPSQR